MSHNNSPKVLVVGGGTTGLYLTLSLLKHGIIPRTIDKGSKAVPGQKAATIWPRCQEVVESFGFIDAFMNVSSPPITRLRHYKKGTLEEVWDKVFLPTREATPDCQLTGCRLIGQMRHQNLIIDEVLPKYEFVIERGIELVSLEQSDDSVHVVLRKESGELEHQRYDYVIGCDGARGIVRKQIGLPFVGEGRLQRFAVGDVSVEGLPENRWHLWGEMRDISVTLRPAERENYYAYTVGGAQFEKYAEIFESAEALKHFLAEMSGHAAFNECQILNSGTWNVNVRMTESFRKGRVFLAGDACHIHTPYGGQGLNTGVQDACNLGWKLALVVKGFAPSNLLDSYEKERKPVVETMLKLTTQGWDESTKSSQVSAMSNLVNSHYLFQLGVNYRNSTIVVDVEATEEDRLVNTYVGDSTGRLIAGDRTPDAPGLVKITALATEDPIRLLSLVDAIHHIVLIFAEDDFDLSASDDGIFAMYSLEFVSFVAIYRAGSVARASGKLYSAFEDRDGNAYSAYMKTKEGPKVVIIRPDGHIGARLHGLENIEEYFKGVLVG